MKPDLTTDDDLRDVVTAFYADIERDEVLGPFFGELDWDAHLPRMVAFWSSVVFHTGRYHGRPFDAHLRLDGLGAAHFARWLDRFRATVDVRFAGEAAERMKAKAESIATIFQIKLGLFTSDDPAWSLPLHAAS